MAPLQPPPGFMSGYDSVLIVLDGLLFEGLPWEHAVRPERLAVRLRDSGLSVSLRGIGGFDSLELSAQVVTEDPERADLVLNALAEVESAWADSLVIEPVVGFADLAYHLRDSGVNVAFASALSTSVAQRAVGKLLDGVSSSESVIGRESIASLASVYRDVMARCRSSLGQGKVCVIAHRDAVAAMDDALARSVTHRLGWGPPFTGLDGPSDLLDLTLQCVLPDAARARLDESRARRDRLRELQSQPQLSNEEMAELSNLIDVRLGANLFSFGYVNEFKGRQNVDMMKKRLRAEAALSGHLLEVISIDATLMEVELRTWLIVHHAAVFTGQERITFGKLVSDAEAKGLPPALASRLRAFNKLRNDAVHHLSRGVLTYDELADAFMADCALVFDVEDYVAAVAPRFGQQIERY